MSNLKNTWTAEEGLKITEYIMNGDSVEVAKAKVLIKNDEKIGKELAATWKVRKENKEKYKTLGEEFAANRANMIDIFGQENFSIYNMASKKNQINALVYGKNNPKVGFQSKKSTGCYGIEA
jgi:hypothetical protein